MKEVDYLKLSELAEGLQSAVDDVDTLFHIAAGLEALAIAAGFTEEIIDAAHLLGPMYLELDPDQLPTKEWCLAAIAAAKLAENGDDGENPSTDVVKDSSGGEIAHDVRQQIAEAAAAGYNIKIRHSLEPIFNFLKTLQ